MKYAAARATCAPARGSAHGEQCSPSRIALAISTCHAGSKTTSSIRLPNRSCVLSSGPKRLARAACADRSEEHTSELQSQSNVVCRLLLEKKKTVFRRTARQE